MALAPVICGCKWESGGEAVPSDTTWRLAPSSSDHPVREQWYAVQTRSRHEKVVAGQLKSSGVHSYLPVIAELHRWSDRRKLIEVPLFSCYTFVHAHLSVAILATILHVHGVVSIVGARPGGTPIPEEEIEAIQRLLEHNINCVIYPFLRVGQRVRIRGGALDGIEGRLLGRKGEITLVVSIELIQRSIAVNIEGYDVELI